MRNVRHKDNDIIPMEARGPGDNAGDQTLQEFIEKAKKSFSHQRVMSFMKEILQDKDMVSSGEIDLAGDEEFILLMLAALKGTDKNNFYRVEFLEDYLINNEYRIPRMRFIRKEKRDVD